MGEQGRINHTIAELERLQRDANELLDSYIHVLKYSRRDDISFGELKMQTYGSAGTQLNYAAALRIARDRMGTTDTGEWASSL